MSTLAVLGATNLHLRFLPLPLHTLCLGTVRVRDLIGHPLLHERWTLPVPGTFLTSTSGTTLNCAPCPKPVYQPSADVIRPSAPRTTVAVAVLDEPPALLAL